MERALRRAGARHRGELRSGGPGGEGLRRGGGGGGGGAAGFVGMGRDATGSAHGLQVQQARSSAHSGRAQRSRRGWHAVWRTPAASWQAVLLCPFVRASPPYSVGSAAKAPGPAPLCLQEGQPNRFCYGNKKALELFECT